MPPRLLITGSRTWTDRAVIRDALRAWWDSTGRDPEAVLVSGKCPKGADRICEEVWAHNGLTLELHPAKWRKPDGSQDMGAGYTRNKAMVDTGPDHHRLHHGQIRRRQPLPPLRPKEGHPLHPLRGLNSPRHSLIERAL